MWLDEENQGFPLHPAIRTMLRQLKIGQMVLLAIPIIFIMISAYFIYARPETQKLAILLPILLVALIIPFGMFYYTVNRKLIPQIKRAQQVMHSTGPRQMRMTSLGFGDFKGIWVKLNPMDASLDSPPWGVASLRSTGKRMIPKGDQPVSVYLDGISQDHFLVVEFGNRIMWGNLTTKEERSSSWGKMRLLFIGLGLFIFASVILAGLLNWQKMDRLQKELDYAKASMTWPHTKGEIVHSRLRNVKISKGKGKVPGFKAEIQYKYMLPEGRTLDGDRIHFGYRPSRKREPALKLVLAYPVGREVDITYFPSDITISVLEPGHMEACQANIKQVYHSLLTLAMVGGIAIIIIVILIIYMGIKSRQVIR